MNSVRLKPWIFYLEVHYSILSLRIWPKSVLCMYDDLRIPFALKATVESKTTTRLRAESSEIEKNGDSGQNDITITCDSWLLLSGANRQQRHMPVSVCLCMSAVPVCLSKIVGFQFISQE